MKWFPTHLRNPLIYQVLHVSDDELIFTGAFEYNTFPIERVLQVDDETPPMHIEILGKVEDSSCISATTSILHLSYRILNPRLDKTEEFQTVLEHIEALEPAAKARENAYEHATMDYFTRHVRQVYDVWMRERIFRESK